MDKLFLAVIAFCCGWLAALMWTAREIDVALTALGR